MFARAFREDEGYWLQLCGYDSTYRPPLDTSDIDNPDLRRLGRMLMRIPESKRSIAVQAAEAMFCGMALVEKCLNSR